MKKSTFKKIGWTLLSLAIIIVAVLAFAGNYMVDFALTPSEHGQNLEAMGEKWNKRVDGISSWYNELHEAGIFRDTVVTNSKGLKQHAVYAAAREASSAEGTAVLVHGYTDNHFSMMHLARMYRDSLNFNVLVFDQQFHGLSEGEAIQMGWLDRLNAAMWTEVAHNIWNDDFMVVHGVSMGAATTMMLSGDPDPEWVDAYIEDCGYTSVWDQFAKQLDEEFGLPTFPILNVAQLICRMRYGWTFKEASSLDALARSVKPVLFIHGDSDTYVPTADVYKNFDAKTNGYKELWIAPDAAHAQAYQKNPAAYTDRVRKFLVRVK